MASQSNGGLASSLPPPRTEGAVFLVGFDFSEHARRALDQAFRFAAAWPGTTVHVVWAGVDSDELKPEGEKNAASQKLRGYLDSMLDDWTQSGHRLPDAHIIAHVTDESPAEAICRLAFTEEAHVILVGTRGRGKLKRMVLGSVAKNVLDGAPCSVLICQERQVDRVPEIEPARADGGGSTLGRRHVYRYRGRNASANTNFPLLFPM